MRKEDKIKVIKINRKVNPGLLLRLLTSTKEVVCDNCGSSNVREIKYKVVYGDISRETSTLTYCPNCGLKRNYETILTEKF